MATQTPRLMEKQTGPMVQLTNRLRSISSDLIYLIELQSHLFLADLRKARTHLLKAVIVGFVAVVTAFVTILIFATGIAYLLHEVGNLPIWGSFLIVAAALALVAGIAGYVFYTSVVQSTRSFTLSHVELKKNLQWVRTTLLQADSE